MGSLDNLVVTMALPAIKSHLHASLSSLEWTVNAYTLTFAVLLLPGATLGDRFGRKKMFMIGLSIFTLASGLALGAWGAIAGLAIAVGPVVGGAIVEGASWSWIFWINVPIGVVLLPVASRLLKESHGPASKLDVVGTGLATAGLFSVVLALVKANDWGWGSGRTVGLFVAGAAFLATFVGWEARVADPVLPMRLFRNRGFTASNVASLFMFFGMFGSIFLLAQFLQVAHGYSPLSAGVRTLPWTAMPIFAAAASWRPGCSCRPSVSAGSRRPRLRPCRT